MNIDDTTIITRNMLDKLSTQYRTQQEEINHKLRLVLDGKPFGETDSTLLQVVDYEQGIISYREECTNAVKTNSVLFLKVEGYCNKED